MSNAIRKAKALLITKETVERAKSLLIRRESADQAKPAVVQNETVEPAKPVTAQKQAAEKPYESKLMVCVEILCTLVSGPMTLTRLCDKFEMGKTRLEPHVRLLWDRGLVEEENFGSDEEAHYVMTDRGLTVLKVIGPLLKEAHRIHMSDFQAVSNALSGAGIH